VNTDAVPLRSAGHVSHATMTTATTNYAATLL